MSEFVYQLPADVDQAGPWPYEKMPEMVSSTGPWILLMNAGGAMAIWPVGKSRPKILNGSIVASRGTKEELLRFLSTFGSRRYLPRKDDEEGQKVAKILVEQGGVFYRFNWVSQTVAQIYIASQMAAKLKADDWDGAWAIGREFEKQLRDAQQGAVYTV